jgi:hypothetical protein
MSGAFDATRVHVRLDLIVASAAMALASLGLAALLRRRGHGGLLGRAADPASGLTEPPAGSGSVRR